MADNVRSEVGFQADGKDEKDAVERTVDAVKGAGFDVKEVSGVQRLIDYLPGEFLVRLVISHSEEAYDEIRGAAYKLHKDLEDKGLKPFTNAGSGFLAPDDSRRLTARPSESSLLNDSGQRTDPHNDDSILVHEKPGADAKPASASDKPEVNASSGTNKDPQPAGVKSGA